MVISENIGGGGGGDDDDANDDPAATMVFMVSPPTHTYILGSVVANLVRLSACLHCKNSSNNTTTSSSSSSAVKSRPKVKGEAKR